MLATPKIKWFVSIILAATLLVLALIGGKWGTTYTASANVYAAPFITSIVPSTVPAGSPAILLVINGSNFGNVTDTRVRLRGSGVDELFIPATITQGRITVAIRADLLDVPIAYILTVEKTIGGTIPGVEISNPVPFTVFEPLFYYLPIVYH
jgi:hypothetical protein